MEISTELDDLIIKLNWKNILPPLNIYYTETFQSGKIDYP